MHVLDDLESLHAWTGRPDRRAPRVLVPTMGALHEGHLRLIDRARRHADAGEGETGEVMVSIFVNPTQFGPGEDLDRYPRTLDADLAACEARGADAAFVPDSASMYADDASVSIHEGALSKGLCGASRPGHFDGVCTVVAKLFNLTRCDAAVFGEKDYQQLAVVRRMVRDLDFPVEILAEPIVREDDGLAMSSRNRYLTPEQRQQATVLSRSLQRAREALDAGERDPAVLLSQIRVDLATTSEARPDYVAAADPLTLAPIETVDPEVGVTLLLAVYFGDTRLIDNLSWRAEDRRT